MQKGKNEHPEVKDIKNICNITPDAETTKDICNKIKKDKKIKDTRRSVK
jgi:hypothetical protein